MEIRLAGYNLDCDIIDACKKRFGDREDWTPETISAAYARISRSPKTVTELRADARAEVEKARRSNESIVFAMGHSSVAEHAVFNLDVLGVSRLLVERSNASACVPTRRNPSATSSSGTTSSSRRRSGGRAWRTPSRRRSGRSTPSTGRFTRSCGHMSCAAPDLAAEPTNRALLEGWAKRTRYIIALATESPARHDGQRPQPGADAPPARRPSLLEAQACSRKMYASTKAVAPSLIRYTEPTAYDTRTGAALREACAAWLAERGKPDAPVPADREADVPPVRLVHITPEADDRIAAAIVHGASTLSLDACRRAVAAMPPAARTDLFRAAFRHLESHDAVRREFEYADLTYELTMSASCYAQWKRHRMATITVQGYDPDLGVAVDPRSGWSRPFATSSDNRETYEDPPGGAGGGALSPHERPPAAGSDEDQRPGAVPYRAPPGRPPRPVGHPDADGGHARSRPGDDAPHPDARRGQGPLSRTDVRGLRRGLKAPVRQARHDRNTGFRHSDTVLVTEGASPTAWPDRLEVDPARKCLGAARGKSSQTTETADEKKKTGTSRGYPTTAFVAKLRRLADAQERASDSRSDRGERIFVPSDAVYTIEHEREGGVEIDSR